VGTVDQETEKLLQVTQESLMLGIEKAVGRGKVYDIARAIQKHVESNNFSIVRELVGHGIGKNLHEDPAVPNFVPPILKRSHLPNVKLHEGLCIAIEPMVNAGTKDVVTDNDEWTIRTADGKMSAHFEHTVYVRDKEAPLILTQFK
jgi:methionyl aminopeptidase